MRREVHVSLRRTVLTQNHKSASSAYDFLLPSFHNNDIFQKRKTASEEIFFDYSTVLLAMDGKAAWEQ